MEIEVKTKIPEAKIQLILKDLEDPKVDYSTEEMDCYSYNGEPLINPKNDIRLTKIVNYRLPSPSTELVEKGDKNFAAYNKMQQIVNFLTTSSVDESLISGNEVKCQIILDKDKKECQFDQHSLEAFGILATIAHFSSYFNIVKRTATLWTSAGFKVEFTTVNDSSIYLVISKNVTESQEKETRKIILDLLKDINISPGDIDTRSWKEIITSGREN